MSLLPPDVHAAILELLNSLKSADNTLRAKAEEVLNTEWVQSKPDVLLMALAEQILASEDAEVSLACFAHRSFPRRDSCYKDAFTNSQPDSVLCRSTVSTYSQQTAKGFDRHRPNNERIVYFVAGS
jgi:hypothetical protein